MPLAGRDYSGTQIQEAVLRVLLISLSMAMIALCVLVIFGLRRPNRSVAQ